MKKFSFVLLALSCSILFMGCPYHSEVPIDAATNASIDTKLLGKWQVRTSDDVTYIVTQLDKSTYSILEKEKKPTEGSEPKKYNAFISTVGGTKFLNLYEPSEDTKSYYFYKLEMNDESGGFSLYPVTEYITETFTASDDLKKFIQSNMNLSFFYGSKDEYIRVGK
jgi:hypothetical protein